MHAKPDLTAWVRLDYPAWQCVLDQLADTIFSASQLLCMQKLFNGAHTYISCSRASSSNVNVMYRSVKVVQKDASQSIRHSYSIAVKLRVGL